MSNVTIGQGGNPVPSLQLVAVDNETIFGDGSGQRPLTTNGASGSTGLTRLAVLPGSHPFVQPGAVVRATGTDDTVTLAFANATATAQGIGLVASLGEAGVTYVYEGPLTLTDAQWEAVNDQGTPLVPGAAYFLSAINDGNITTTIVGENDTPLVQVGVAINSDTMLVNSMLVLPQLLPAATPTGSPTPGMVLRVSSASHLAPLLADGSVAPQASGVMFSGNTDGSIAYKTNGPLTLTTTQWDAVVTGESGGLTPGSSYYASAAAAGKLVTAPPSATGSYIVLIGTALSATTLIINISAPVGPHG